MVTLYKKETNKSTDNVAKAIGFLSHEQFLYEKSVTIALSGAVTSIAKKSVPVIAMAATFYKAVEMKLKLKRTILTKYPIIR